MNKKLFLLLLFFLFCTFSFSALTVEPKYLSPSEEVITPHINWLKPYKKGPIKVLFITYRKEGGMREVIELAQRSDLNYTVFPFDSPDSFYEVGYEKSITDEMAENLLMEKLKSNYDIIVLGNIKWSVLPLYAKYQILKKVKEGTSILGYVRDRDEYLNKATEKKIEPDIQILFPYKGLPAFNKYTDFNTFLNSTLEISQFGKGKIILLKGYKVEILQALTPVPPTENYLDIDYIDYDYYLSYIIQLILYASNKQPEVIIKGNDYIKVDRDQLNTVEFIINSKEKKENISCEFTLRDKENKVMIFQEEKIALLSGENKISFDIKKVPAGRYYADLLLKEGDKIINFGSSYLEISSQAYISEVEIKKSYLKEETITGKVIVFTKTGEDNLKVKISQRDNFGRITYREIIPVGEKGIFKKEALFSLKPTTPLTIIQYLDIELYKGKDVLDRKKFTYSISNLYPKEDDIRYILWAAHTDRYNSPGSYLSIYYLSELYKGGFDTQYSNFCEAVSLSNLYHLSIMSTIPTRFVDLKTDWHSHPGIPKRTKDDHIRVPCLTDPEYLKQVEDELTSKATKVKPFSTKEFSIGDECLFVNGSFELCFSRTCIAKFHQFLKEEYGTIENLNKEYESNYKSFEEIQPVTLDDVKKDSKLIPLWVDYRRHMENTWAGIYQFSKDTIQKVVPEAKIGYEGSDTEINSYRAADFYKLMQVMELNCTYDRPFINYAIVDFSKPGTVLGLGWYGGYSSTCSIPYNRYISWRHLLRGANSFWVWWGDPGEGGSVVASDLSFYDYFKENIKQVKEMKEGIGKLFITSKRDNDKIGILYSASSVHCSTLTPELPSMEKVLNSLATLFEDSGYQFQVIAYKQLEEGILKREDFRLLFLPYCQSISEKEGKEIKEFVEKGGIVIADIRPGVSDQHGKAYKKGILDEVFGIEQRTTGPEAKKAELQIKDTNFPDKFPTTYLDSSIKLAKGQAKEYVEGTPVLIINNYGKGKAILLNFSLSNYVEQKGELESGTTEVTKDSEMIRNFFKSLFSFVGIDEKVKTTPEISGVRKYRFISGNIEYLGLLQELPEPIVNYAKGTAKPLVKNKITINLPKKYNIYNVREGKYLGYTDEIKTEIEPADAIVYALLPYKVEDIVLTIPKDIKQGDILEYGINIKTSGEKPEQHIYHLSIISPEGKEIKHYTDNLKAEKGNVSGKIQLALNEVVGEYKIRVKDIATGKEIEKPFRIMEAK